MSLFDQFETDTAKEIEGVPVKYAPNKDGTVPTFFLSRMGKKAPLTVERGVPYGTRYR